MHAEDEKLATALAHLRSVDVVLCVGDLVDGAGDLDRCVELLEAHRVVTVRGNHDRWVLGDEMRHLAEADAAAELAPRTRVYLAALPATRRIDTVAGPLLLCHGLGTDDMEFVNDGDDLQRALGTSQRGIGADLSLIVNGHTHTRWAERVGRLGIVNAGTLRRGDACRVQFHDLDDDDGVTVAEHIAF